MTTQEMIQNFYTSLNQKNDAWQNNIASIAALTLYFDITEFRIFMGC